jgi:hypothetical protein
LLSGLVEVDHPQPVPHPLALGVAEGHRHPVADQIVLVAVRGDDALGGDGGRELAQGVVVGRIRQARVQRREPLPQHPGQHHLALRAAPEQAIGAEVLVVEGVHRLPAELLLQVLGGGLLDQGVFGVGGGAHVLGGGGLWMVG